MKISLRKRPAGVAIFLVMISIIVLASMAWVFAYNMRVEMQLAMNSNNEDKLEWGGRSGVERARWMLGAEMGTPGSGSRYDALNQAWAGGTGDTNDFIQSIQLKNVQIGDDTIINVTITDAERKLNINTCAFNQPLMTQALILIGVDASEIPTIVSSIQDWIDPDDETHPSGAESDYYQTLDPPYNAKNGPIDDISELLMIKGIRDNPELYWGPNSTNHGPSRLQGQYTGVNQGMLPNAPQVTAGLKDLFTPISNGLLNINTCSATELRMIGMDEASAERIISMRQGPDGQDGTDDDMPFQNPGEIMNAGLPNNVVQIFQGMLTVRSSTFEVLVDVQIGNSPARHYHSTLRRNGPRDIQVLTFWWD